MARGIRTVGVCRALHRSLLLGGIRTTVTKPRTDRVRRVRRALPASVGPAKGSGADYLVGNFERQRWRQRRPLDFFQDDSPLDRRWSRTRAVMGTIRAEACAVLLPLDAPSSCNGQIPGAGGSEAPSPLKAPRIASVHVSGLLAPQ